MHYNLYNLLDIYKLPGRVVAPGGGVHQITLATWISGIAYLLPYGLVVTRECDQTTTYMSSNKKITSIRETTSPSRGDKMSS